MEKAAWPGLATAQRGAMVHIIQKFFSKLLSESEKITPITRAPCELITKRIDHNVSVYLLRVDRGLGIDFGLTNLYSSYLYGICYRKNIKHSSAPKKDIILSDAQKICELDKVRESCLKNHMQHIEKGLNPVSDAYTFCTIS